MVHQRYGAPELPFRRRYVTKLLDAPKREADPNVRPLGLDDVEVVETIGKEGFRMGVLDVVALERAFGCELPVDIRDRFAGREDRLAIRQELGQRLQRALADRFVLRDEDETAFDRHVVHWHEAVGRLDEFREAVVLRHVFQSTIKR